MIFERINFFIGEALKEARSAFDEGCIPIGAVIVFNDRVIARARNKNESFFMHAEIECIKIAERSIGTRYLNECEMFVTLSPCLMCSYAIFLSKIRRVFYCAFSSDIHHLEYRNFVGKIKFYGGFCESESLDLLKNFFFHGRKKNVDF
jgi:tRNA(adenine34) deaminase